MNALLLGVDGISCRPCGARSAQAPREATPVPVCGNCWKRFRSQSSGDPETLENEFNAWLARQVVLQARRLRTHGMVGRCEARSMTAGWPNSGYQCAHGATTKRDGRSVCTLHEQRALDVTFIDEDIAYDPYADFGDTILHVARVDQRFASVVRAVASELEAA